jgi:hypothetical protein
VYIAGSALVDAGSGAAVMLPDVLDARMQVAAGALLMLVNSAAVVGIGVLLPVLSPTTNDPPTRTWPPGCSRRS